MPVAILGHKRGMTRYFTEDEKNVPVTVIECGACAVTQIKTAERDGYSAIQIGYDDVRPHRSTMPLIGHDAKAGVAPKRVHRELRLDSDEEAEAFELGQALTVSQFEDVRFVDVIGTSKGKGFQGPMKRHNFRGLRATHGVKRKHRSPGSIAGHATDLGTGPKLKKGKRMAGHMGQQQVTARSLDVVAVDPERNVLIVKGPVPGPNNGVVFIRTSKRLYRRKALLVQG